MPSVSCRYMKKQKDNNARSTELILAFNKVQWVVGIYFSIENGEHYLDKQNEVRVKEKGSK